MGEDGSLPHVGKISAIERTEGMSGQQAYLYQKNNKAVDAVIDWAISPSGKPVLIYPVSKRGNGNIRAYGSFTGQEDARYEVKVLDTALENPVVSAPVFRGAGTGKISDIAASGLEAQKISVECLSTGTSSAKAIIEIEGLRFRAKYAGSAGNGISVTVDDSKLLFTETDYSTVMDLKEGDTGLEGQEWDFDTKVLQGDLVPADARRIAFGQDMLHIYVQYKKFEDGKWKYYFIQPVQYAVNKGTPVYFVTGGRTITVTDGVTTETYAGIITAADLWQKVKASSAVIEPVDSSIDTTRGTSSPAVREMTTKTDAYFLPAYAGEKSSEYAGELDSILVRDDAKTELIQIECADNSYIGAEVWNVKGSSSGNMGQAKTGEFADFGRVGFTVPQRFPKDWGTVKEDWSYKVAYASRDQGVTPPGICFFMRLGINSQPQTLVLEYKKKPVECGCPAPPAFSDKCLGFDEKGGEIGMSYTVPDLLFWTDAKIDTLKESNWLAKDEPENFEGRSGSATPALLKSPLNTFESATAEYVSMFKALAQRIMGLPEDAPSQLQAMVDQYKAVVESLTIASGNPWTSADPPYIFEVHYDTTAYMSLVETVLNYERTYGVKKNSVTPPGSCYIDPGGDYYWEVRGSKAYLPAFTDTPYYSTVLQSGQMINTKDFAFLISTPCGGELAEGDTITVSIGGVQFAKTYQLGDITYLPTVAGQDLLLNGGVDGDDTYTFGVTGEKDNFPDYLLNRTDPAQYATSKLSFQIDDGVVMFQVADIFEFNIEGGRWIWKKDGGAWSAPLGIAQTLQALDAGLSVAFDFGVSPSFLQGDTWEVLCVQENKAANMIIPQDILAGNGTGNITLSFDAPVTVDTLIIDKHDLAADITLQASNQADFGVLIHNEAIPVSALICKIIDGGITAQYFRIIAAGENRIGYLFLGNMMQLSLDADSVLPLRRFQMSRTTGSKPFSLLDRMQWGYNVGYSSFILNADFELLDEMIQYLKSNNDMPLYFLANINYPDACIRATIDADNIEFGGDIDDNAPQDKRLYTVTIPVVSC
jgi:hypothetical protein